MVATTDCEEKSKPITGHKVSKPLMEKKRRARINKCLDQLKTLLESYYSTNIRKRKLEKADILELTVKHLRNLQKIQSCSVAASEFSDYQTGFRSCLANVNQYLVMTDAMNGMDHWMLSQLSSKVCRGRVSSTMDSGPIAAEPKEEARGLFPSADAAHEQRNTISPKGPEPNSATTSRLLPSEGSSAAKQAVDAAAPAHNNHEQRSSHKKCLSVGHRNEDSNAQHSVWRPW
nr:hairy-related 3 [Solea senegalensis]